MSWLAVKNYAIVMIRIACRSGLLDWRNLPNPFFLARRRRFYKHFALFRKDSTWQMPINLVPRLGDQDVLFLFICHSEWMPPNKRPTAQLAPK
jgi:hypothetical protein